MKKTVKVISYETLATVARETYEVYPTLDTLKTKALLECKLQDKD